MRGWLSVGQPYDLFWHLTPSEIGLILEVEVGRVERQAKARLGDIHALASLISIGFHNPKKFPSRADFIGGSKGGMRGSSDAQIKSYFLALKAQREVGNGKGADRRAAG